MMTPTSDSRAASLPATRKLTRLQQRGFTLLEIILVMAIIATASILVVPNLGGLEARTFKTQIRQAHSLLNYARRTAVVSGQASTVSFNVVPIEGLEGEDLDADSSSLSNVVAQWHGAGIELSFRDSTDREIEIEESTEVTFYPEGGSTGGVLLFSLEDQRGVIDIDPFSGRVTTMNPEEEL